MFPQAELENYKLQVELLQEKLQRSEENRHQLEHKLDKIIQKRTELDKCARHKTRQRYQEFLDEQKKRNDRNKILVQMLERIDQQTAAMSARSERLKMMKLQYQMYFAKLVQTQTMRCLQVTPTPTGIHVLVPTETPRATVATPSSATTSAAGAAAAAASVATPLEPISAKNVFGQEQTMTTIAAAPLPQQQQQQQQQWTLAMATPTQGGMLLTTPTHGAATVCNALPADYLPYPLGLMPRRRLGYDDFYDGGLDSARNLYDLRASLHAYDSECADLAMQRGSGIGSSRSNNYHKSRFGGREFDENREEQLDDLEAVNRLTGAYQAAKSGEDQGLHAIAAAAEAASSTLGTLATSSLANDKLPKPRTLSTLSVEQQQQQQQQLQPQQHTQGYPNDIKSDDIDTPQIEAFKANTNSSTNTSTNGNNNNNIHNKNIGYNVYNNNALSDSRVTGVEQEKSSSFAVNNDGYQEAPLLAPSIADNFASLKIDESSWARTTATNSWQPPSERKLMSDTTVGDAISISTRAYDMPRAENAAIAAAAAFASTTVAVTAAASASAVAAVAAAAASNLQPAELEGNQLPLTESAVAKPLSIENIENAIYGELLNPAETIATASAAETSATTTTTAMAMPNNMSASTMPMAQHETRQKEELAQGLLKNLVTAQTPTHVATVGSQEFTAAAVPDYAGYEPAPSTEQQQLQQQHSIAGSEVSYEPSYATIDGNNSIANMEQQNVEPIYAEIGNPTVDYQQQQHQQQHQQQQQAYDSSAATSAATGDGSDAFNEASQEEYANIDYSNYDASQYGGAYDPNAYPGYIYDETTGQYIADPNATQYATDESYAGQGYEGVGDVAAAMENYDYGAAYAQQQQQQQPESGASADVYSEVAANTAATMPSVAPSELNAAQQSQQPTYSDVTPMTLTAQPSDAAIPSPTPTPAAATASTPTTTDAALTSGAAAAATTTATLAAAATTEAKVVKPTSILSSSTTDKQAASNDAQQQQQQQQQQQLQQQQPKKKKRVNFVDSSETDESSSAKPMASTAIAGVEGGIATTAGSESDFDFSVGSEAQN